MDLGTLLTPLLPFIYTDFFYSTTSTVYLSTSNTDTP
jgi:hypothetical protein